MAHFNIEDYCRDPVYSVDEVLQKVRATQTHEINQGRTKHSEYHHLFSVLKKYPQKFKLYTRMELTTFNYILSKINNSLLKNWCNLHQEPIQPEEKLVVTIRFLVTGVSYSDLSFSFLMGKSTICNLIEDVLNAIWTNLSPIHMPPPTADSFMNVAQDFYLLWDIPHCVGAIDVRYIRIKKPSNSGSIYFNYKKFFSIPLQAVVDAHYRFLVIDVGGYGYQHDATTFRSSNLYRALKSGKMKFPDDDELYKSRTIAPYFLIGDGAYPLNKNLIKPYPGKHLSEDQKLFNKRLSRARVVVECAFGQLCQKWHIFYKTIELPPKKTELIVKGACTPHNIMIDLDKPDTVPTGEVPQTADFECHDSGESNIFTGDGQIVRAKLLEFFLQNPIAES